MGGQASFNRSLKVFCNESRFVGTLGISGCPLSYTPTNSIPGKSTGQELAKPTAVRNHSRSSEKRLRSTKLSSVLTSRDNKAASVNSTASCPVIGNHPRH